MKDFDRFVKAGSIEKALDLLCSELKEIGIEVNLCMKCGGLVIHLTKSKSLISEHHCFWVYEQ